MNVNTHYPYLSVNTCVAMICLQLTLHQDEENRLLAERDRIQDEAAGITRDEIIEQVRADRDQAIERSCFDPSVICLKYNSSPLQYDNTLYPGGWP